jgi:hypothetical protein
MTGQKNAIPRPSDASADVRPYRNRKQFELALERLLGERIRADDLALQLHVSSKVCLPCCGLMSPSPHRPSDNISRFNLTLGQPIGDASDLLN